MSREIIFRAWDKKDQRMIVAEQDFIPLLVTHKGVFRLDPHLKEDRYERVEDDRFDIMQFTGLKDKNGKEIYEGDLMQHSDPFTTPIIVKWNKEFCGFVFNEGDTSYTLDSPSLFIIGNIHENPELLK